MQLGALMTHLSGENDAMAVLEAMNDIVLFAEVSSMASRFDETPSEYVAASCRRFARSAGDEDWLGLVSALERGDEPSETLVRRMLRWALDHDASELAEEAPAGCSCGGSGGCHEHT